MVSCAQAPKQQTSVAPDEQALEKGLKLLANPEVSDKKTALPSFEKACNLGNNYGCHKMGIAYNNGLYDLNQDYDRARQWYLKAAEKGYIPSQQNIANLYAHRLLGELNDVEGYKWLALAETGTAQCLPGSIEAERGVSDAERRRLCNLATAGQGRIRSIFRKRMLPEEIAQAEQLAKKWQPK
ncbi:MAG: hypothetical protein AMJ55_02755 [Gammaproteobacteria bacterium SG8_15]|nr:MAG: hypothetical protein AMJ55_02755 [Gammaproteobacteria bacterium SG8_15]